jgi:ABC-2 type transport system ATP-binding protein
MKRQLALLLGICANTKYLFCDESFDGLDPVMRQSVKSLFASDMVERGLTPVIASHNLRELEDICDHVGLLHKGGVLLSEDLENLKLGIQRIQVVFRDGKEKEDAERIAQKFKVLDHSATGKVESFTLRGEEQNINAFMRELEPKYYEPLPLTLEEIFIAETESAGYDIRKLILG